jgi:hypothetical protein
VDWLKRKSEERAEAERQRQAQRAEEERARREAEAARQAAEEAYLEQIVEDYGVVKFRRSGSVWYDVNSAAEAKLAIKQLRLKKKELTAEKREISSDIAEIRAEYRTKAAGRIYMGRGGGKSGAMMRAGVRAKRRGERLQVEADVVPLEREKAQLDARMLVIDRAIAQIEADELRRD